MKKQTDKKNETTDLKMVGVRMSPELIKAIKQYALDHDTSIQDITVDAVKDYLKKHGVKLTNEN